MGGRLLITGAAAEASATDLDAIAQRTGTAVPLLLFPDEGDPELTAEEQAAIEIAYFSPDLLMEGLRARRFLDLVPEAPNLRWLHLGFAGIDSPRFGGLLDRGVRLSNSPGAAAEPIAHSAMAGLLSLARRLPYFAAQQREHVYQRLPREEIPAGPERPDARHLRSRYDRRRAGAPRPRVRAACDRRSAQPALG